ncbi:alpha/beta fold hydrolase [Leifsonia poae]|uniref:alpha/beta fold hydrolase n=1 Tax=Leifsonia poae TaxID=110933 RepID=UPI003D66A869
METYSINTAGAEIVYDVTEPTQGDGAHPPLVMIGQPMDASGFRALTSYLPDRKVITYDPRGLGRSTRSDGEVTNTPTVQAEDVHAIITTLGAGPVDMFASSGGAVTAMALVAAHPEDLRVLVAHEPPLPGVLPDSERAERAMAAFHEVYNSRGFGAGMAAFIMMTSWRGEFTDDYFALPAPDPAMFGLPADDNGSRDDPLLSERSNAVTDYRPDVDALKAAPTRVVIGVGEESEGIFTGRAAVSVAKMLDTEAVVFPSHHGGFGAEDSGYPGKPEAFARRLREVLDAQS